jgi:hypothetical protein
MLTSRKRTHLAGQPPSSTSLHATFICGLALLYSVFLQPNILPLRDVFAAIKAASNTLFAYSQQDRTASALFEVFEDLSSVCIERASASRDAVPANATAEWMKASKDAASNISE